MRWNEYRAQQIELFVSDKSWWTLNDLKTDEGRFALVAFIKSEIEYHGDKYSAKQLKAMKKAYADISSDSGLKLRATTPQWFIPWYELIVNESQRLGTGGFGTVHHAKRLESEVVVKKLTVIGDDDSAAAASFLSCGLKSHQKTSKTDDPKAKTSREVARKMFEREVEIWFGLSHPHVVRLFDACHVGVPFFVCEYATNGSLDKYLRHRPGELWSKLHEAALGVLYLHERGIIHGDLKCNNIVMGSDAKAKVTDFGLSAAQTGEVYDKVRGAWQWVAPECLQVSGGRSTTDSDVYTFGMCIVEAMRVVEAKLLNKTKTECPPYPWGVLDIEVMRYKVLKGKLPLRPSAKVCSNNHCSLVERMCKHDPQQRLKITTVVDELAKLATSGPDERAQTRVVLDTAAHVSTMINELKQGIVSKSSAEDAGDDHKLLRGVYRLLLKRLDHVSSQVNSRSQAYEQLKLLVERVRDGMTATKTCPDSLTKFTETALHAYALHRQLDKFMAANFLAAAGDDGDDEDHDWKPKCQALMKVERTVSMSAAA